MKTKSDTLSRTGRLVKVLFGESIYWGRLHYSRTRSGARIYFVISIIWLIFGIKWHGVEHYIFSAAFGALALISFLTSGFQELIEKEYIKKDSNQSSEPT